MSGSGTYWHGGPNGLEPGDPILPASALAALPAAHFRKDYPCDPHRVYVTVDRELGLAYASNNVIPGGGSLYRVDVLGDLAVDPDYPSGVSVSVEQAVILEVVARSVEMSPWRFTRAVGRFSTWDDGTPMYDERGRSIPSRQARELGFSAADLAPLGQWVPFEIMGAAMIESRSTGVRLTADLIAARVEQLDRVNRSRPAAVVTLIHSHSRSPYV